MKSAEQLGRDLAEAHHEAITAGGEFAEGFVRDLRGDLAALEMKLRWGLAAAVNDNKAGADEAAKVARLVAAARAVLPCFDYDNTFAEGGELEAALVAVEVQP